VRDGSAPAEPAPGSPPALRVGPALVDQARQLDPEAWDALYRSVYPRLRAYVARRVGAGMAEDLVNETMTRAVAGIDRFVPGPAGMEGWLFGIARRVTADHLRRAERERRAFGRTAADVPGETPGEAFELGEDAAWVRAKFALLSRSEQDILELRVVAGLSADDVAIALGKRPGAVRTAQSRALANLRKLMDQS